MWELLAGTLLGLGSAMIVSKSDSLRRRRDAASLVRLKLESWADDVERTTKIFREQNPNQTNKQLLVLLGGLWQRQRPRVSSLFESRLAELMGFHSDLDEHLIGFHEAVAEAEDRFASIEDRHGEVAFLKEAAKSDLCLVAAAMHRAAGHAIKAVLLLEDLFTAGWEARWKRLRALVGLYSGPPLDAFLEAAQRDLDLLIIPDGK